MANVDSHNLEKAVKEIVPEKAGDLAAKYKTVMDSISGGLIKSSDVVAEKSKDYLQKLATDVIDTAFVSDENKPEDKKFMVQALDQELDNIASVLGLNLKKIDVAFLDENFSKIDNLFKELHIDFSEGKYKAAYLETLQFNRIDISTLTQELEKIWKSVENSNYFKSYLHENQDRLMTSVGQFCNGSIADSLKVLEDLQGKIKEMYDPEVFNRKTGLNLSETQVNQVIGTLKANNMTEKQIFYFFEKVKAENADNFAKLDLSGEEATVFLVGIVLDCKGGKQKFVANEIFVESLASKRITKEAGDITKYVTDLSRWNEELRTYRSEHPDKIKDSHILSVERNIAVLQANIKLSELQRFKAQVKKYLAMSYAERMSEDKDLQKVAKEIFSKISVEDLRKVAEKFNVALPPDFGELERIELDYQAAKIDLCLKDELNNLSPDSTKMYEQFYAEFASGRLDTGAKKEVVLHQIYEESQAMARLSDMNEEFIDRDRVAIYGLIDKYGRISEVPEEQREAVRQKVVAYLGILNQGHAVNGKLLATYINVDLLDPKQTIGKDKTPIIVEVANLRNYMTEIGGSVEDVSKFLEIKDFKVSEESEAANSPLYAPILAREVRPFNDKYEAVARKVFDSSNYLGTSLAELNKCGENPQYFEDRAIPPTRLFRHALEAFGGLEDSIGNARNSVSTILEDLQNYRVNVQAGKVDIIKKYPALKDTLLRVIDSSMQKAHFLLENNNSPISQIKLDQLKEAKQKLQDGFDEYLSQGFKNILVGAIIIAAAVAGGIVAAGLLASAGVENLILVSGGAALGGTLASRGGMALTNVVGWSKFTHEDMWSPENLAKDFLISWGLSLAAIGTARYLVKGLNRGAASTNLWMASKSKVALERLAFLQKISPSQWFGVAEGQLTKGFLKKFGIDFAKQYGQTVEENTMQSAHPVLGFAAMLVNASHGVRLNLAKAGVDVSKINAIIEGNRVAYTTAKPEEFVREMEGYFAKRNVNNFQAEIHPDGTVKITVEDAARNVATLDVKPARVGIEPAVAVRRVDGIKFDEATGIYSVNEANSVLPVVLELRANGFVLEKTPNGFRAVKGNLGIEIKIDPRIEAEIRSNFEAIARGTNELTDIVSMAEKYPSPNAIARLRLGLASLAMSLLNSGCGKVVDLTKQGLEAGAGGLLEVLLNVGDYALPFYALYKIGLRKGAFSGFPAIWKQVRPSSKGLGQRIEKLITRLGSRPDLAKGGLEGDTEVRKLAAQLEAVAKGEIINPKGHLNLIDSLQNFWIGPDRAVLEPTVSQIEGSTNIIFRMFTDVTTNRAAWNKSIFDAEVAKIRLFIPKLIAENVRDVKILPKLSLWLWGIGAYFFYRESRGSFLQGDKISHWMTTGSTGENVDKGYGKPPEGAPSEAPSTTPSEPEGAPAVTGSISEGQNSENTLPDNLKGKGFFKGPEGVIYRKNYPGTYEIMPDGSVVYDSLKDGKFRLPPNGNVDSQWPKYTEPVQPPAPATPEPTPAKPPVVPDKSRIPSVDYDI